MNFMRWLLRRLQNSREQVRYCDTLEIILKDKGKVIAYRPPMGDLITNVGKAQFAGLINGVVTLPFTYVAIGTGATAAAVTDTQLQTEITTNGGQRKAGTCTRVQTTVANDTAQIEATYTFTGSFAITESGCFDANPAGNMCCRQVFDAYNVVSGNEMTFRWKIKAA
jgi:hypothetical protein